MSAPLPQPGPRPRSTSLVGPVVLTVAGALALVAALVVAVLTVGLFVRTVDSDVLARDGGPGTAVIAAAPAPGATRVELTAGERYAVHLVVPRSAVGPDERPALGEDVLLLSPSGQVVAADRSPGVTTRSEAGGFVAASVGALRAPETGTYEVAVPAAVPGAWVALTPDTAFAPFFGAVWGTVLGVFVVIGLGAVGSAAVVGGVVWWVLRARARRAAAA